MAHGMHVEVCSEGANEINTSFLESNLIRSRQAIKMVITFDGVNPLLVIYSQEIIQIKMKAYTHTHTQMFITILFTVSKKLKTRIFTFKTIVE